MCSLLMAIIGSAFGFLSTMHFFSGASIDTVNSDCTSMAMDCMISSLICLAQQEHLCSLIACYCMASVFKIL